MSQRNLRFAIIAYFLIYAGAMVFVNSPYEGPDEIAHLDYMNFLAKNHILPDQTNLAHGGSTSWEHHQPPLYYMLGAAVLTVARPDHAIDINLTKQARWFRPPGPDGARGELFVSQAERNLYYLLRFLSVLMGAFTLVYVFRTSLILLPPDAGAWNVFPGLFVATLPQFAFDSALVNNDALANLLATAAIYYAYRVYEEPARARNHVALGISLGMGLLAKKTLLVLLPMIIVVAVAALLVGRPKRRVAALLVLAFGLAVLIAGGWYLRNYQLYGEFLAGKMEKQQMVYLVQEQPLYSPWFVGSYWASHQADAIKALGIAAGVILALVLLCRRSVPGAIRLPVLSVLALVAAVVPFFFRNEIQGRYAGTFFFWLFASFIGHFAQMEVPLPDAIYALYGSFLGVALIGLFFYLCEKAFKEFKILVACGFVACAISGVIYYNLTFSQAQGRLLFSALSPFACVLTVGLYAFLSGPRFRSAKQCAVIALLWLFAIADAVSLWRIYGD
jgi:hypothetical protein